MKVWEKLSQTEEFKGQNKQQILDKLEKKYHCSASVEAAYGMIGDARIEKFCNLGCSVSCVEQYLDLKVK
jgi:hypothetical protein